MKFIATDVDDSPLQLQQQIAAQKTKPGFALASYFCRSPVAYQRELDRLIYRSWIYAAHVSEVPAAGDYVLLDIDEDSIIICRDEQGEIRALQNICRHRGSRLCEDPAGNKKTFVCPYHGWVYNIDGSLKVARDMERLQGFDPEHYGLQPVRFEVFMGLIFINGDPRSASFLPTLERVRAPLGAYDLANAKIAHQHTYRVQANWKLAVENYLECYHCATSHRHYARMHSLKEIDYKVAQLNENMLARAEQVTGVEGIDRCFVELYDEAPNFGGCISAWRYALYEGYQTGSKDGQPVAPLMGNMQGYDGGVGDFQLGPVSFMLNYPDYCVLYRFVPRGLTQTDMHIVWFVNGDAQEGVDYETGEVTWLWHNTSLEDDYIITRNSEGVNSRFFVPGPYHPDFEYACIQFVNWYLEALGDVT